ncbi:hypothetical protein CYL18_18035 [Pradoshia eiseniae]|uniref:Uncharacterized protein n=1 Tax=Pradoshia eiseniae TaxID=2064768 RepID=A0A2S7MVK1_9BACI|nr:hypothetical protein CYL18_18035 [Pradoshia eiseniae]
MLPMPSNRKEKSELTSCFIRAGGIFFIENFPPAHFFYSECKSSKVTPIEDQKYKLKAEVESLHANDNRVAEEGLQIIGHSRHRRE